MTGSPEAASAEPDRLQITTLAELFDWYSLNLCKKQFVDPRGMRVRFLETDFVHLIKLTNKYGIEPRNRQLTIDQIRSGRITLVPGKLDIRRATELSWAQSIVETPDRIVPNWQVMGRANPGDAYIKNFGTEDKPTYRILICGHAGNKRFPVTIFPRERFAERELTPQLWP
ncbi:MAG TPA: hypothetical protein VL346_08025 [Acidobacteriaceae bacterium]|nr:hypothetical protein [Acidobacteriaceae bacterium]